MTLLIQALNFLYNVILTNVWNQKDKEFPTSHQIKMLRVEERPEQEAQL